MKVFLISCVLAIVVAVAAAYLLDRYQRPSEVAYSTSSVRL